MDMTGQWRVDGSSEEGGGSDPEGGGSDPEGGGGLTFTPASL